MLYDTNNNNNNNITIVYVALVVDVRAQMSFVLSYGYVHAGVGAYHTQRLLHPIHIHKHLFYL